MFFFLARVQEAKRKGGITKGSNERMTESRSLVLSSRSKISLTSKLGRNSTKRRLERRFSSNFIVLFVTIHLKLLSEIVNPWYLYNLGQVSNLAKGYQCGNRTRRMVRNRIRTRTFQNPWLDSMVNRNSSSISWDDRESRFISFAPLLIASLSPFSRAPLHPFPLLSQFFSFFFSLFLLLFLLGKWRRSFPDYRRTSQFDSVESAVGYERNHSIGRETAGRFLQRQGSSPVRSWGL